MNSSSVELTVPSSPEIESVQVVLIDPRSEGPIRAELLGLERLEGHADAAGGGLRPGRRPGARTAPAAPIRGEQRVLIRSTAGSSPWRRPPQPAAASTPNGCSTTSTSSRRSSARSARTCRAATTRNCPSWPSAAAGGLSPRLRPGPGPGRPHRQRARRGADHAVRPGVQEVAPLTIGELWAVPTMLRLVLLENLRRLAEQMLWGWDERQRAERWAAESLARRPGVARGAAGPDAGRRAPPPPFARPDRPVRRPAAAAAARPGAARPPRRSSSSRPSSRRAGPTPTRSSAASTAARRPTRSRSATASSACGCSRPSTGTSSSSSSSRVEAVLRDDPAGVYAAQDFATRDRYRRAVETIARGSSADELDVARRGRSSWPRAGRGDGGGPRARRLLPGRSRAGRSSRPSSATGPRWRERLLDWALGASAARSTSARSPAC